MALIFDHLRLRRIVLHRILKSHLTTHELVDYMRSPSSASVLRNLQTSEVFLSLRPGEKKISIFTTRLKGVKKSVIFWLNLPEYELRETHQRTRIVARTAIATE